MGSPTRLTKQGVRDLDFGVKRKPAPAPAPGQESDQPADAVEVVEVVEVVDVAAVIGGRPAPTPVAAPAEPVSPPAGTPAKGEPRRAPRVVVP